MKVLLIGAFSFDKVDVGGQPVKCRELYYTLTELYGADSIRYIETIGWKKRIVQLLFAIIIGFFKSDAVIMLPGQKGVKVFSKLLTLLKGIKRDVKIFYDVVGGWLPESIIQSKRLGRCLKKFNGIWVETKSMQDKLYNIGFNNIITIPNFRNESTITNKETTFKDCIPHRLCMYSRVMPQKGVSIAINAINTVNKLKGKLFELDIYGPIDDSYKEEFFNLVEESCGDVKYCGIESPANSSSILSNYFALLFPTFYEGEGMAGTVVDALFAGCPIIASNWKYNKDIIDDNLGIIFEPINVESLISSLLYVSNNVKEWLDKRKNCIYAANKYTRAANIKIIMSELESN